MAEHLNSEEIALELTKETINHYNHRVNNKSTGSHLDAKNIAQFYQYYLKVAQWDIDLTKALTDKNSTR